MYRTRDWKNRQDVDFFTSTEPSATAHASVEPVPEDVIVQFHGADIAAVGDVGDASDRSRARMVALRAADNRLASMVVGAPALPAIVMFARRSRSPLALPVSPAPMIVR